MKNIFKMLFILILLFHIVIITLIPNSASIITKNLGKMVFSYATLIGINQTWEFFSPTPASPLYFDYTVYFEDSDGQELQPEIEGSFPEFRAGRASHPNEIRLKSAVRFLSIRQDGKGNVYSQYLCRKYPNASRVVIRAIFEFVPPLENVNINDGKYELIQGEASIVEKNCKE